MSETTVCQICGKTKRLNQGQIADVIRPSLFESMRKRYPYKVNLKAELEIRHLHEKIDHLLRKQYNRLFEIQ